MEHVLKQWPDGYYKGIPRSREYQSIIIFNGVMGTFNWWRDKRELSHYAMRLRMKNYEKKLVSLEEAMRPKEMQFSHPRSHLPKCIKRPEPRPYRRVLPSGIYEAGPLL